MSRLDRGFDALGRARSPELWKGIQQREPRPLPEGPSLGSRLVTVVVAFAVAVAGVTFGIRAFRSDTGAVGPGTVNGVIAFTAIPDETEIPQVYSVRPDGSLPRQLTEDPTIKGSLEWSPDGSELAFVSVDPALEAFEVVSVMAADGSGRRVLCEGCSASILVASCSDCGNTPDQVQPSSNALHWSPDGSLIAAPAYRRVGTDDYEDGINLIDVETGEPTFIPTDGSVQGLSWSPDGASLAVGVHGPDDALGGIFVVDRESLELRPLTGRDDLLEGASSPDRDPVWSPDGSHIAFTREVVIPREGSQLSTEQIFVMRADGEEQRPLTSPEAIGYPFGVWRPDGQALTILAAPADTPGEGSDSILFDASIADSTTSELMDCRDRAPETPCPSGDLVWSPDGSELAFQADGFGGANEPAGFFVMRPGELPRLISGDLSIRVPTAAACCLAWQALREGGPSMDEASPDSEQVVRQLSLEPGRPTQIGDYANSIAIGEGGIWVAVHALEEDSPELVRLDPETGDIVARIPATTIPSWVVGGGGMIVANGNLWVAGSIDQHVGLTRIDPSSNEVVETIRLERGSGADVWVDDSGIWVLAFVGGGGTEVIRLDPVTREVVARIPLPARWAHQVVASNGSIWVHGTAPGVHGDVYPDTIYRIDPATSELVDSSELPSPDFPLAADALAIWQRTRTGVARVDPAGRGIDVDLEMHSNACCDHIASDGVGGVWMIGWIAEDRLGAWHLTGEGVMDHIGALHLPREAGGIAVAFDTETLTFWTAQYRDSVTPIRIRSDEGVGT